MTDRVLRPAVLWGIAFGAATVALPLAVRWLEPATVHALSICVIASAWVWLLVIGYFAHGAKDLWEHRSHFVANTRWWPPFCLVVDWIAAVVIAIEIAAGVNFH